jgi:predicted Zn-dependent protease
MRTGRPDSSLIYLDALLRIQPGNANAHRMKGEVLAVYFQDAGSAERSFLKAFELDPSNSSVAQNLGVSAFKRGDVQEALGYFLKAVEAKPDNEQALLYTAQAYTALGNEEEARRYTQLAQAASGADQR